MERVVSKHFTNRAANKRYDREVSKLLLPGKKSSGWARRKFMVRKSGGLRRWKVVEL